MNGRSGLSFSAAQKIGQALGLQPDFLEYFIDLVLSSHGRSKTERTLARSRLQKFGNLTDVHDLSSVAADVLSKWHYLPLIELVGLSPQGARPSRLAHVLGLEISEIIHSLEKLSRLGLVIHGESGTYHKKFEKVVLEAAPGEPLKQFNKEVLRLAYSAIDAHGSNDQVHKATLVAIRRKSIPEAQRFIERMEREFLSQFHEGDRADALYFFSLQFFKFAEKESL
jgi:uncharacterized protein (TIGR02147 family)